MRFSAVADVRLKGTVLIGERLHVRAKLRCNIMQFIMLRRLPLEELYALRQESVLLE